MFENARELDQFYTNLECAKNFFNIIQSKLDLVSFDYIIEPSVGNGAFYHLFDHTKRIAIDIDPKIDGAIKMDFLKWDCPLKGNIITIGNPPFGKNSNLAVDFFNHSATFSNVIAFILPKTFRKNSFVKKLDKNFHLIYDEDVPKNSFIFNNKSYDVSCCFQIWQRQINQRQTTKGLDVSKANSYFDFVEPKDCDFIVQRVGVKAGQIIIDQKDKYTTKNFFYIKSKHETTLSIFQNIDFNKVKHNTVGYPSVSKKELVELFLQELDLLGFSFFEFLSKKFK
jgi:hypothetical protein